MAGLRLRPREPTERGDRDRGQILLVGAFGIAVLLLVFAGVLNTATYTESLATRDADYPSSRDVAALQTDTRDGVAGVLDRINDGPGTYTEKIDRLDSSVGRLRVAISRQYATDLAEIDLSVTGTTEGSRITQATARLLTNDTGASDWTLVTDVPETRTVVLRLNRSSLVTDDCGAGTCFELVVEDGTASWNVSVNQSTVYVEGPAESGTCPVRNETVSIDAIDGTVDGQTCDPLAFARGLSSPYDIRYRNGGAANGTYRLVVGTPVNDTDYAGSGDPSVTPIVYDATPQLTYVGPELTYSSDFTVSGSETDE